MSRTLTAIACLLLTGCVLNSDKYPRPRDLAPNWLVDRTRLLGWGLAQAVLAAWWCIEDGVDGWEGFIRCAELIQDTME